MKDVNSVVLIGRLTRDAEMKYTSGGLSICNMAIAVNRNVKHGEKWEDEPNFFDIVMFGKQGEAVKEYLVKGKRIGIQGELHQEQWEQDGQKRSKVKVIASNINLLDGGQKKENYKQENFEDDIHF
jgi:single-strand DNA-binding protein